jgi:hypothetical protein
LGRLVHRIYDPGDVCDRRRAGHYPDREVADQSALSGILMQLSDMNLKLIAVNPVPAIS